MVSNIIPITAIPSLPSTLANRPIDMSNERGMDSCAASMSSSASWMRSSSERLDRRSYSVATASSLRSSMMSLQA